MAGVVVEMYATGKIAELAELHKRLGLYVTREKGNKVSSLLMKILTRITLDVVFSIRTRRATTVLTLEITRISPQHTRPHHSFATCHSTLNPFQRS